MKINMVLLQIILCTCLLFFCIVTRLKPSDDAVKAGTFGEKRISNESFEDYVFNTYGDLL